MESVPPSKQYLKIGEVSKLTGLNSSVLRFWETEFDALHPMKSRAGQRLYSRDDLELVLKIKRLLYDEKLTIAGAKGRISPAPRRPMTPEEEEAEADRKARIIREIRQELVNFRNSL